MKRVLRFVVVVEAEAPDDRFLTPLVLKAVEALSEGPLSSDLVTSESPDGKAFARARYVSFDQRYLEADGSIAIDERGKPMHDTLPPDAGVKPLSPMGESMLSLARTTEALASPMLGRFIEGRGMADGREGSPYEHVTMAQAHAYLDSLDQMHEDAAAANTYEVAP